MAPYPGAEAASALIDGRDPSRRYGSRAKAVGPGAGRQLALGRCRSGQRQPAGDSHLEGPTTSLTSSISSRQGAASPGGGRRTAMT
jgi:hypothetical protein